MDIATALSNEQLSVPSSTAKTLTVSAIRLSVGIMVSAQGTIPTVTCVITASVTVIVSAQVIKGAWSRLAVKTQIKATV